MRFKVGDKVLVVNVLYDDSFEVVDVVQIDQVGEYEDPNCYVVSSQTSHIPNIGYLREEEVAPITNGDKIRAMSNREMAEFLFEADYEDSACVVCPHKKDFCTINGCIDALEAWLNSEAEDN